MLNVQVMFPFILLTALGSLLSACNFSLRDFSPRVALGESSLDFAILSTSEIYDEFQVLKWEQVSSDATFSVTLALDSGCTDVQYQANLPTTEISTLNMPNGVYFLCVSATSGTRSIFASNNGVKIFILHSTICRKAVNSQREPFAAGEGSSAFPFIICTPKHFLNMRSSMEFLEANYRMMDDLDFSGIAFEPVGSLGFAPFAGVLDGRGHFLRRVYLDSSDDCIGLFGYVSGGSVHSLSIQGFKIRGLGYGTGLLAGCADSRSTFSNIQFGNNMAQSELSGIAWVGGLVGMLDHSSVRNSYLSNVLVVGQERVGGLIGWMSGDESYISSTGVDSTDVTANRFAGGFVGEISGAGTIENSYARNAVISGENWFAGFVGYAPQDSTVRFCYADLDLIRTSGNSVNIGHFVSGQRFGSDLRPVESYYNSNRTLLPKVILLPSAGIPKTRDELSQKATYEAWDFETPIWIFSPVGGLPDLFRI